MQSTPFVLITGASGFVGSHLTDVLRTHNYPLRLTVPPSEAASLTGDVVPVCASGNETDWRPTLAGIDVIVHLAARVHVLKETTTHPLDAFRAINTDSTRQLALQAVEQGVRRLVFISTIGVNGNSTPADQPFSELSPVAPHNPYAQSKWEAEQILSQIARETGLEVVIVRPPLVYGPHVPGNFSRLLKLTSYGLPLPLGNIKNRRSFISRTNLASFLHTCIECPQAAGETFLVSDGQDVSTTDLIRKIAHHLDRPARLFPFPESVIKLGGRILGKEHMITQIWDSLVVDPSKARDLLDWKPPITMDEELAQTADWFKRNR